MNPKKDHAAVLLVDDDPRNLLALESLLETEDYSLVKAQTSDEALLALMSRDFAAIVLDVQMPDVNGIELAGLIKQRKRTQHIPILFLTAHYREDEHAMMAYSAGAVDYLTKPINPAVLRSKVNVFVDLFRKTRALEEHNLLLQREAEERNRRIEAEAANAAKDRFLAMLSHELRTPLTPIVYSVSLLEKSENCPPEMRGILETIRRNIRLEVRLIDDLLDLARIRNGKLALEMQPADAHEILRAAVDTCRSEIQQGGIQLVEEFRAGASQLQGDPARLQQIFWNLLTNAAKFTPRDGAITIRTENDEGGNLIVEISDSGMGIEPDKLRQIFDAFEQVTRRDSGGLGLGLAICKALVELHGGKIEAHSEGLSHGASFRMSFPSASASRSAVRAPRTEAREKPSHRILVVEDHADTAESLRLLLELDGHQVRTVGSIAEALKAAPEYDFDLLISDIGLPDGNGTDLLLQLRKILPRPIRAIAMTGFGTEHDVRRSTEAGFTEHLTKPVEYARLRETLAASA
jgi:signal transduction histidine kinase